MSDKKGNNEVALNEESNTICGLTDEKIEQIEKISQRFQLQNINSQGALRKALLLAQGVKALEEIITDEVMAPIMYLQGKKLGFKTDRDGFDRNGKKLEPYKTSEVKPIFIESQLRGLMPAGNQFNILVHSLYITKEGYTYLIQKLPGVTDYKQELKAPTTPQKMDYVIIECKAKWKINGVEDSLTAEIPVHRHSTDKVDNWLGKAERKLKYRVHCQITQSEITESEELDSSEINTTDLNEKSGLKAKADEAKASAAENTSDGADVL